MVQGKASPAYPTMALSRAVELARTFADRTDGKAVDLDGAVAALGFGGVNGSAKAALSTVRQYGLVLKQGGRYRLGPLGQQVCATEDETALRQAMVEAALRPPVFVELSQRFGEGELHAEGALAFLDQQGYLPSAAKRVLAAFGQTMSEVGMAEAGASDAGRSEEADERPAPRSGGSDLVADGTTCTGVLLEYQLVGGAVLNITLRGSGRIGDVLRLVDDWSSMKGREVSRR